MTQRKVDISAVVIWLRGEDCYHLFAKLTPQSGAALPTLARTFMLARLTRRLLKNPQVSTVA
ncbi:hypothetical protein IWX85_003731 [Polaromonas sp. CG_9.11]|nr:hypothetical protein [Polaromonas sp. CG_9.11]